ncbi:MAG: hypothetical protein J6W00_09555 [Lentisphaeria bacterium]|nr:hypothetical protein [Lentisphaeria bacterium]
MSYEIFFLGNRGVGKTTMLAVMAHYLAKDIDKFDPLHLEPDDEKFKELNRRWSELLATIKNAGVIPQRPATEDIIEHRFRFSDGTKSNKSIACSFIDTPGGSTYDADPELCQRVRKAVAIICIVDAVDLMEFPEEEAIDRCAVSGIQRLLKGVANLRKEDDMAMPIKCLFILTKCEKYMHSTDETLNAQALSQKFTACFRQVLKISNLTSFYLPVETLGCLEFSHFDENGFPQWRKCHESPRPVNIYQPLCFAMSELLEKLEEEKNILQYIWDKVLDIFGVNDYKKYRQQLSDIAGDATELSKYDRATGELSKTTSFE